MSVGTLTSWAKVDTGPFDFGRQDRGFFADIQARETFRLFVDRVTRGRFQWNRHALLLADRLMRVARGRLPRLIVMMPPRMGKSEQISRLFPAYYLHRHPASWVGLASYGAELARTFSRNARANFLAGGGQINPAAKAQHHWETGQGGGMWSAGVGGAQVGKGYHLGIIDDPVKDAAEANSALKRESIWDWYLSTFYTRREPNAAIVLVLTRWHQDDLAGRLIREFQREGGEQWEILRLPAIAEENDVLGRLPGELLWPERYPAEDVERTRATMTEYWWGALYQQAPVAAGGTIFNREWWQFYDEEPRRVAERADEVIQSWDMTFKKEGTSWVVCQVWARSGADRYLILQSRDRLSFPETQEKFREVTHSYFSRTKLVEEAANGRAIIDSLSDEIPGIVPVGTKGQSKEERANAIAPLIRNGNVYLPNPDRAPWVREFIAEHADFPRGMNDDQVDACSQALRWFSENASTASLSFKVLAGTTARNRFKVE